MALSEHINQMKRDIAMLKKHNLDKLKKHDEDYNRKHNNHICGICGDVKIIFKQKYRIFHGTEYCESCGKIT